MTGINQVGTYEQIMNALLAYLQNNIPSGTFQSFRRGIVMWSDISKIQNGLPLVRQPALYLYDGPMFGGGRTSYHQRSRSLPVIRTIHRTIVIYAQTPSAGQLPGGSIGGLAAQNTVTSQGSILHPLLDAVETAMETPDDTSASGALTLGGLVSHCYVEGDGFLFSPDIDENGQGMATLPVQIVIPHGSG